MPADATHVMNLDAKNEHLTKLTAQERLEWAFQQAPPNRIVVSSSFGATSAALLHLVSEVQPGFPILFLQTGYHFQATLDFAHHLIQRLGLTLWEAEATPEEKQQLAETHGEKPHQENPDACCGTNKVVSMQRALEGKSLWISGVRAQQTAQRSGFNLLQPANDKPGLWRLHPILDWSREQLQTYLTEHDLPYHPLVAEGYRSIGCEPCTKAPGQTSNAENDERAGRWSQSDKTECGLHYL